MQCVTRPAIEISPDGLDLLRWAADDDNDISHTESRCHARARRRPVRGYRPTMPSDGGPRRGEVLDRATRGAAPSGSRRVASFAVVTLAVLIGAPVWGADEASP